MAKYGKKKLIFIACGAAAIFAFVAVSILLLTRAAAPTASVETESGVRSGDASVITATGASGGSAVKFGQGNQGGSPATIVAVSDMQYGRSGTDRTGTARRVTALAAAADYVIMAGDIAYDGRASQYQEFNNEYGSIMSKLRPALGNHDNYSGDNGAAYNTYFNSVPHGTAPRFWYSFNVGSWHVVSLNVGSSTTSFAAGSEQLQWLEADLAANRRPTILYFHYPRYTGSNYSGDTNMQNSVKPIWNIALAHKVEIIVNGHDHSYQRFAPMDAEGRATANGIREFIAATGCYSQRNVSGTAAPNMEKWSTSTSASWCGALELKLFSDRYEWRFINNAGTTLDSGSTSVHTR